MNATAFRYITDAITKEEALALLKAKAATKAERETHVREVGYPAYVTSAGWLGYSDEKVARLSTEPWDKKVQSEHTDQQRSSCLHPCTTLVRE